MLMAARLLEAASPGLYAAASWMCISPASTPASVGRVLKRARQATPLHSLATPVLIHVLRKCLNASWSPAYAGPRASPWRIQTARAPPRALFDGSQYVFGFGSARVMPRLRVPWVRHVEASARAVELQPGFFYTVFAIGWNSIFTMLTDNRSQRVLEG